MSTQAEATALANIDPTLRCLARLLPYRYGLFARHLRVMRAQTSLMGLLQAARDVDVVAVSPTASVRVHRPHGLAGNSPAVLWIHGGGYVAGCARMDERLVVKTAHELGALVVSVEYRLAPEHPYPAALDDCYAALRWLAAREDVDRSRILVAGVSAGGGLAAALALRCLDSGLVGLAGQILVYPMLDDRTVTRSTLTGARGWTPEDNAFGWRSYLGCEPAAEGVSAYAAPSRRRDLTGLPPTWIGVGTADLFHDENLDYATRLRQAGVSTQLYVVTGAYHGFDQVRTKNPLAQRFHYHRLATMRDFLAT
jgi:acetyl esterase/lipase